MCDVDKLLSIAGKRNGIVVMYPVAFEETFKLMPADNNNICHRLHYIPPSLSDDVPVTSVEVFFFVGLTRFTRFAYNFPVIFQVFVILGGGK